MWHDIVTGEGPAAERLPPLSLFVQNLTHVLEQDVEPLLLFLNVRRCRCKLPSPLFLYDSHYTVMTVPLHIFGAVGHCSQTQVDRSGRLVSLISSQLLSVVWAFIQHEI